MLSYNPNVIIATVGRLSEIIQKTPSLLNLNNIRYLVFDEADKLISPTCYSSIPLIISAIRDSEKDRTIKTGKQILLFSATLTLNSILLLLLFSIIWKKRKFNI